MPKQRNSPDTKEITIEGTDYSLGIRRPKVSQGTLEGTIIPPESIKTYKKNHPNNEQTDIPNMPTNQDRHEFEVITGKPFKGTEPKKVELAKKITLDGVDYKLKKGTLDYHPIVKKKKK
jgi:hypothetical protein